MKKSILLLILLFFSFSMTAYALKITGTKWNGGAFTIYNQPIAETKKITIPWSSPLFKNCGGGNATINFSRTNGDATKFKVEMSSSRSNSIQFQPANFTIDSAYSVNVSATWCPEIYIDIISSN